MFFSFVSYRILKALACFFISLQICLLTYQLYDRSLAFSSISKSDFSCQLIYPPYSVQGWPHTFRAEYDNSYIFEAN